jgi:hypothetical protein
MLRFPRTERLYLLVPGRGDMGDLSRYDICVGGRSPEPVLEFFDELVYLRLTLRNNYWRYYDRIFS